MSDGVSFYQRCLHTALLSYPSLEIRKTETSISNNMSEGNVSVEIAPMNVNGSAQSGRRTRSGRIGPAEDAPAKKKSVPRYVCTSFFVRIYRLTT